MSDEHERQARAAAPAGGGAAARASGGVLLEVPADRLVQDWQGAHARALSYLEALGVAAEDRRALPRKMASRVPSLAGGTGPAGPGAARVLYEGMTLTRAIAYSRPTTTRAYR